MVGMRYYMKVCELLAEAENEFQRLKKHKKPLTAEERTVCFDKKGVWHNGPGGEPTCAVWKSVNPKTKKVTYVTHTHRAYNTSSTLKGAIHKFRTFIKGTS